MSFIDQVARSPSAHRCTVMLVTAEAQASRLSAAIREIGIGSTSSAVSHEVVFGTEQQTASCIRAAGAEPGIWSACPELSSRPAGCTG